MRRALPAVLLLLPLLLPACGTGNIGDLFSIFPKEAFEPPSGGGGGGGTPTPFVPKEVAALGGGQGVTGNVRNVAIATVGTEVYAFLAAGTDGVHVVNVTRPDLLNKTDVVTTIRDSNLTGDPAAEIAGGAVHDLAVVDSNFLVCIAVGTGALNAVTVFEIPTLIANATSPTADLSAAFVPPAGGAEIPVPGVGGKGGGVSGSGGDFLVATGGAVLRHGVIDPSGPSWSLGSDLDFATATPGQLTDVLVNQTTAVYASGKNAADKWGVFAAGHPDLPIPAGATFTQVEGDFSAVLDDVVTGPGSYPLNLAHNTLNLYATGDDEMQIFNITTNPFAPSLLSVLPATGVHTIAVSALGTTFGLGTGSAFLVGSNAVGAARITATITFPGTFTIRGSVQLTTDEGAFALVCAGTGGLRVIQLTQATP